MLASIHSDEKSINLKLFIHVELDSKMSSEKHVRNLLTSDK